MNLYIIQMFQTNVVFLCYFNRISCQMWKICRMLVCSTDSAACKDCILRIDFVCSVFIFCFDSHTFPIFDDYIRHLCIFIYLYILKLFHLRKQLAGDLFSRHIFMKQDMLRLVGKRRQLLEYLKKVDIERYRAIVKALELRK